jgi:hypothetical protein
LGAGEVSTDDATVERAALAAARAGEVVEVGDAFAGEVVAVVQAAVKAAVRNIPGHVSDRAAEGIARAALHAFTPRLAVLLREAEARGAAREPAAAPRCEHDDPSGYVGRCRPCGADARSMPCDECGAPSTHVATPGGFRFCDDHGPQR